ncbi:MAG: DUF484 family protein [Burkholderiaceae bacterium]
MTESSEPLTVPGELQVADYLREHPDFFRRHTDLLGMLSLPHPHGGRAISLQERQLEVMREKHRTLERRIAEMIRMGQDNDAIAERLQRWTRQLLLVAAPESLPEVTCDGLRTIFAVPMTALRIWSVRPAFQSLPVARPVAVDAISATNAMDRPYCGSSRGQIGVDWLEDGGEQARSVALLPLRKGAGPQAFGLLVLGSPDADRFEPGMGTAFLERIAETAGAALGRLAE